VDAYGVRPRRRSMDESESGRREQNRPFQMNICGPHVV
jgi:hypothetical protein